MLFGIMLLLRNVTFAQHLLEFSGDGLKMGRKADLRSFAGKPMLIELFTSYCVVCFRSLPEINKVQEKFKSDLSIVLIGDDENRLPSTYEKYRARYNLKLNVVFDSTFHKIVDPPFAPYYIWVNRLGEVIGKSGGDIVNEPNIRSFIREDYSFLRSDSMRKGNLEFAIVSPEKVKDNSLVFRRLMTAEPGMPIKQPNRLRISGDNNVVLLNNVTLEALLLYAVFGQAAWKRSDSKYDEIWPMVVVRSDSILDQILERRFSYELRLDSYRTSSFLQNTLLEDLCRTFDLKYEVVHGMMPCWTIRLPDTVRNFLKSKEHKYRNNPSYGGVDVVAGNFDSILDYVIYQTGEKVPVINKTGITWAVDLKFDAVMTDWNDVVQALRNKGFLLEKELRSMDVLIVTKRD